MSASWVPGESVIEMIDGGETPPLFDVERRDPGPRMGPDARRTARYRLRAECGYNPLRNTPAHAQAPKDAAPEDRHPRDYTCGTCLWAQLITNGGGEGGKPRTRLKCTEGDGRWVTLGPATTISKWWPACQQWQPQGP